MVPRRTNGAEAPGGATIQRHVDGIEDAPGGGGSGIPGAEAGDRIGVEMAAACLDDGVQAVDVMRVVGEGELVTGRVPSLDVQQLMKEIRTFAERARDRPQPADMLRVSPARVVTPAVGVGDERDRQGSAPRG